MRAFARAAEKLGDESVRVDRDGAEREVVADFFADRLLTDEAAIRAVCEYQPTTARGIRDYIKKLLNKLGGKQSTLEKDVEMYNKALKDVAAKAQAEAQSRLKLKSAPEAKAQGSGLKIGGKTQYSTQAEVLERNDVDWAKDNSGIKEQLIAHAQRINEMEPVASVEYANESGDALVDLIMKEVSRIGGQLMKNSGITFMFDKTGASRIVYHASNRSEILAATLAAPYVAKYGELISGQKNHENSGTTTLTFAAPVIINGETANEGVVIEFTSNGRPRAVNVETQTNKPVKIKKIEALSGIGSRVSRIGKGTALPTENASEKKVTQNGETGKRQFSADVDEDYMAAVEAGNMETAQRMVDEAAKAAGYSYSRFTRNHLSPRNNDAPYYIFADSGSKESLRGVYGQYEYAASDNGAIKADEILPQLRDAWREFVEETGENPNVTDEELNPEDIGMAAGVWDNRDFVQWLFDNDFFTESTDAEIPAIKTADGLIVFGDDMSRIKSADLVTYDDNGNVIPLSERFNRTKDDIRWSVTPTTNTGRTPRLPPWKSWGSGWRGARASTTWPSSCWSGTRPPRS